jgi:osmoprotectant transport system substrate-binding protein
MRSLTKRPNRLAALGVSAIVLIPAACGSSSSKTTATNTAPPTATVASKLTLGGAPECPQRPYCIVGLQKTYGITFASFKPLDADGPLTYQAVTAGQIGVALVFSSDALIADKGLVVLGDDKHLQSADNIVPVVRTAKATPAVTAVLNKVSALITTTALAGLNKQVSIDKADPADVATQFLKSNGLDTKTTTAAGATLTVGSVNFDENVLLAEIYGQALQDAGASVTIKTKLGTRETVLPGLEAGKIDLEPEYAASALEFVNKGAGEANGDITATAAKLRERLATAGVTVLDPTPAQDTNAFAVTKATADKYHLVNMSDLAKPAA